MINWKTVVGSAVIFMTFAGADHADAAGVRGMEHVGITVPDLAQARDFFTGPLGCEEAFALGPFADPEGNWMADNLATDPRAQLNISVLKCGNATNVELFEFQSPAQRKSWPKREDHGATSLGFYVDDLEKTVAALETAGVTILGGIKKVEQGPIAGRSWIYAQAPWGLMIFLMSEPNGIAYEKQEDALHLFSPRNLPE